jgi:iron(III) transport system permease protein
MPPTSSTLRATRLRQPPVREPMTGWRLTASALLALPLLPIAAVAVLALRPAEGVFAHVASTVLPRALADTALLVALTGSAALLIGTVTAWLVTMYRFPGRSLVDRLLVLPFAIPAYILAYVYVDLLDYGGPVQTTLRGWFGWTRPADYLFPDIRSLYGAVFVLTLALYPYVYLAARASFVQQSVCVLEVARTLGRTPIETFWAVALPMARPALAAGVALVAMECVGEFGALQHLGISTLTVSVFSTWLARGSLPGAAQLALLTLVLVGLLLWIERQARAGTRLHHTTGRWRAIPFQTLEGPWALGALVACALPVLFGFVLPLAMLGWQAVRHLDQAMDAAVWTAAWNGLRLAVIAAVVATAAAVLIAYAGRVLRSQVLAAATLLASLGYALPGVVLALGLKLPVAGFEIWLDGVTRASLGIGTGLFLSGTLAILVLAHVIRFLAVSLGAIEAGFERLSLHLDQAARTLGVSTGSLLRRIHLPLLVPALGTAGLLVFVDTMKELPATLLLRPFNFETLATHVYALVKLEQVEAASVGALMIVAVGLVPVLLLHRAIAGGRAGQSG